MKIWTGSFLVFRNFPCLLLLLLLFYISFYCGVGAWLFLLHGAARERDRPWPCHGFACMHAQHPLAARKQATTSNYAVVSSAHDMARPSIALEAFPRP